MTSEFRKAADNQPYAVESGDWQGEPVMVLHDYNTQAVVMVAPQIGANTVFWSYWYHDGNVEVLETPDNPEILREHPTRAGVPVLWPFPGRVADAHYTFDGKEYQLPHNDKTGIHSIHGIVMDAKWQVDEAACSVDADGAHLVLKVGPDGVLDEWKPGYPFDFELTLTISLKGYALTYHLQVENKESQTAIPFSFGLHPYFCLPLSPKNLVENPAPYNERETGLIHLPVKSQWPTDGGVPTGLPHPTPENKDFQQWKPLGSELFDDMYSDVIFDNPTSKYITAGCRTPETNLEVQVHADPVFQDWVLYTPPLRAAVAIEPYTSPPNAINMVHQYPEASHLITLPAGQKWSAEVIIQVVNENKETS